MIRLAFKRLHPDAVKPAYANPGDACFDLYPVNVHYDSHRNAVISTGLSFDIPKGYALMIYSRSGMGFKHGDRLANCVGVIDSGYKGEVKVRVVSDQNDAWDRRAFPDIAIGKACAQAMLIPVPSLVFEETDDVGESERGENGFGSSDKKA